MTNPFSNEALVPNWTVATEILKGDVVGHEFHGNQYTHGQAASALRDLAAQARIANMRGRLVTDVLGVSGARDKQGNPNGSVSRYSTPAYGQSQTDNAKEHNRLIAEHAENLATLIESDPDKSVEQHIADFQNEMGGLYSEGHHQELIDNPDAGRDKFRSADAGLAVADHLSNK